MLKMRSIAIEKLDGCCIKLGELGALAQPVRAADS